MSNCLLIIVINIIIVITNQICLPMAGLFIVCSLFYKHYVTLLHNWIFYCPSLLEWVWILTAPWCTMAASQRRGGSHVVAVFFCRSTLPKSWRRWDGPCAKGAALQTAAIRVCQKIEWIDFRKGLKKTMIFPAEKGDCCRFCLKLGDLSSQNGDVTVWKWEMYAQLMAMWMGEW